LLVQQLTLRFFSFLSSPKSLSSKHFAFKRRILFLCSDLYQSTDAAATT
jgi:hypothetical protein